MATILLGMAVLMSNSRPKGKSTAPRGKTASPVTEKWAGLVEGISMAGVGFDARYSTTAPGNVLVNHR